ncbi:GTPase Era [Chondrinema litorale]|uniref:GTPase Era n=1 Tax=Chondrinema litorale TaxID=2994555 RepID=UPI002544AC84|nr:GTPase Era [Chondrinema litorale]UZR93972.1 GTPase Era [Chondrinema litorale]
MKEHKAGFVNIIGKPNAGKSTLMNGLVGEKLSIITSKAQTTRHRIMGMLSGEDYQIIYSDTPGIIEPKYELHAAMMKFVETAFEDADIILYIVDIKDEDFDEKLLKKLEDLNKPIILVINKIDLEEQEKVLEKIALWKSRIQAKHIIPVSALHQFNIETLFDTILEYLPAHPPYFDKESLSDKTERFFAAEIIREKIFLNYEQEVPYASEVSIISFKETDKIIRVSAEIYVERKSQKAIIIGKGGASLKKVGIEARKDMEKFFGKQVFLETHARVEENWRKKEKKLDKFGYNG